MTTCRNTRESALPFGQVAQRMQSAVSYTC